MRDPMSFAGWMMAGAAAGSALAWVYLAFFHGRFWSAGPFLESESGITGNIGAASPAAASESWPSVAVVVPARNESQVLPETLPPLLGQDYPGPFRVILVDDHSADDTSGVARKIAQRMANDAPLRAGFQIVKAAPLGEGWAGKLWALDQGVRSVDPAALPDYYLFTDADILHSSTSLRSLVAQAQARALDLVSLMVLLRCRSFWEKLLIPAYVFFFQKLYPFSWSNDASARTAAAAGGCILIRASALDTIGGIAAIRGAIIDDCALARKVKDSGGALWIGMTRAVQSLRDYPALRPLWNMVARTAFTQLGYSWLLLAGAAFGMLWLYGLGPALFAAGLILGKPIWTSTGGLIWLGMAAVYRPMTRFYGLGWGYAFALPLTALLYTGMTLHSGWRHLRGQTGNWKGRNYFEALARR